MPDIIYVKDLVVQACVGVEVWEQAITQKVSIDFELKTDITKAAKTDDVNNTLNYQEIAVAIREFVENTSTKLLEALAERTAAMLLDKFPIMGLRLRMSKPYIVSGAKDAGVIIERGDW